MKIVFSWDDGSIYDKKLFELHRKYLLPAIFFVPTRNSEGLEVLSEKDIRLNRDELISFGGHTENHVYLTDLSSNDVEKEIKNNKYYLEDILGERINHFCLPGGAYNLRIIDRVFENYKTVRTADTMNFEMDGMICRPTIHFFDRGKKSLIGNAIRNKSIKQLPYLLKHINEDYFELIKKIISYSSKDDSSIVIWGHSWEIEKYDLWVKLEELLAYIFSFYSNECIKYDDLFRQA